MDKTLNYYRQLNPLYFPNLEPDDGEYSGSDDDDEGLENNEEYVHKAKKSRKSLGLGLLRIICKAFQHKNFATKSYPPKKSCFAE